MAQRFMILDKGILTGFDEGGNQTFRINATTGRPGCTDSSIPFAGPIPAGKYTLNPEEITGGFNFRTLARNFQGDWGIYRAPLHPNEGTYIPEGRDPDTFFIHGGLVKGSAGCIDVGTPNDVLLFNYIRLNSQSILVIVSENPTNWTDEEIQAFEDLRKQQGW